MSLYKYGTLMHYHLRQSVALSEEPIVSTAAKDGKAAKGSLGDGAVKLLRTTLPKLDFMPGLMSELRILSRVVTDLGMPGDWRA